MTWKGAVGVRLSTCCGAPLVTRFRSDTPNFTDDDYDLKVPVRVCSQCGKEEVPARQPGLEGGADGVSAKGVGAQPEG